MTFYPGPTGSAPPKTKISGYKQHNIQKFTPEQLQLFQQLSGTVTPGATSGTDWLSKLASGDTSAFEEMEKPAYNAFEKQVGALGNRFSHLGALDSNYFENAISGAGRELQENLASNRMNIRQNAINSLLNQSNTLLGQSPFESIFTEKKKGFGGMGLEDLFTPENIQMLIKILPLLVG